MRGSTEMFFVVYATYFIHISLEDLLVSTADHSEELVSWHERCDDLQAWVDHTLSLLETRPVSLTSSYGSMKRQQSVTEV